MAADKTKIREELLRHLTESPPAGQEGEKIKALAHSVAEKNTVTPPDAVWRSIQQRIAMPAAPSTGFIAVLKILVSAPLFPAYAVLLAGIMVGAVFLLNKATAPQKIQIVEIAAQRPQQKGDVLIAKAIRIENSGSGGISRISAAKDKIIFHSGDWKVSLRHSDLEKPVQFFFPGGALEPIGTAFNIKIRPEGTDVQLTEGKIRLLQYHSEKNRWENRELSAPFHGVLAPQPLNTEPVMETPKAATEKKVLTPPRYVPHIGREITIELKNGDRLTGKLRSASGGKIVLAAASGNLTVRDADVVAIYRK